MAHIANCMRPVADKSAVHITQETATKPNVRCPRPLYPPKRQTLALTQMDSQLPRRSQSLRNLQAFKDPKEPQPPLDKSPSLLNLHLQPAPFKYHLWPSSKSHLGLIRPAHSDKSTALSMGRSSSSLSDTAVSPETVPLWQRGSPLARRRKVSVPELGGTMATVQEVSIDSRKNTHAPMVHIRKLILYLQQPSQDDHRSERPHKKSLVTRDPAVHLAPAGQPLLWEMF